MNTSQLSPEQKEKLQKIWDNDYQTIVRGKDNGVPFLTYVFELHYKLFGTTCSSCPNKLPGYVKSLKNLNTSNQMKTSENSNFKLQERVTIPIPGTSKAYSNHNLTDEIAIELIAKNPNRKALFVVLPKDVDAQVAAFLKNKASAEGTKLVPAGEVVTIGAVAYTVGQAVDLLAKVGVETKATTAKGINGVINKLSDDKGAELIALTLEVNASTDESGAGSGATRTKEDIEFDLEKAEQDLADLVKNTPDAVEEIKSATERVETLRDELVNA